MICIGMSVIVVYFCHLCYGLPSSNAGEPAGYNLWFLYTYITACGLSVLPGFKYLPTTRALAFRPDCV